MRVVPCKTSYCKTKFKWNGILQVTKKLKYFFPISYKLSDLSHNRKLFSCLFWFGNFSLLKSKMSWWWDHQSIIWRNRLIAKLKDGFCQGRSDHLSKKKSNTLMIIMPLRQLLHRKAQKTSHCFIAYRNLKNGQKYVSMIKSRN